MQRWTKQARLSYDPDVDMGYIQIRQRSKVGHAESLQVRDKRGILRFVVDVDAWGRLIGIEVFNARVTLGRK